MFPIYVLFPIFGIQFICRNFERLGDPVIRTKFGELTEGLNIKSRGMVVYWAVDLFRRICLAHAVVFAISHFWLQSICFFLTSVAQIIAVGFCDAR